MAYRAPDEGRPVTYDAIMRTTAMRRWSDRGSAGIAAERSGGTLTAE